MSSCVSKPMRAMCLSGIVVPADCMQSQQLVLDKGI